MGYGTRSNTVRTFTPDDDENTIHLQGEFSLEDLDRISQAKWPYSSMDDIKITTKYIQNDPSDYTCFIVLKYYP